MIEVSSYCSKPQGCRWQHWIPFMFPIKHVEEPYSGCWLATDLVCLSLGVLGTPKSALFSHLAGSAPANTLLSLSVQGPGTLGSLFKLWSKFLWAVWFLSAGQRCQIPQTGLQAVAKQSLRFRSVTGQKAVQRALLVLEGICWPWVVGTGDKWWLRGCSFHFWQCLDNLPYLFTSPLL